jgi:hypothetical protein
VDRETIDMLDHGNIMALQVCENPEISSIPDDQICEYEHVRRYQYRKSAV